MSRRSPTTGLRRPSRATRRWRRGVNVLDGKITYEAVADAHGLEFHPLEDVLLAARRGGSAGFFLPSGAD